jgi:hypothetical protein
MRAFFAIALQTIRTSVRQKVFLAELPIVLLIVTLLPANCQGDGTAVGWVQLTLSYTLGLLVAACSAATLWIACVSMSREIEGYQMHLVTTAPAPRWRVWLGKWAGVFALQSLLFLAGSAGAYGMIHWQLARHDFPPRERERLKAEVLLARREFAPPEPDFWKLADAEYARRRDRNELAPGHDPAVVRAELCRQVKARSAELPAGGARGWKITGITPPPAGAPAVFLRYRLYVGDPSAKTQPPAGGRWEFRSRDDRTYLVPERGAGGVFRELPIPPELVHDDGTLEFAFLNIGQESASVVFQPGDGPSVLVPAAGFAENWTRASLLVLFQLAFLAALGCTVSAVFSSPVAVFMAAAYLAAGLLVGPAVSSRIHADDGSYVYKNRLDQASYWLALGARAAVVSLNDFDAADDLAAGRLVTNRRLAGSFAVLIGLRTLPLALLGIWIFSRRELGLVVREQ